MQTEETDALLFILNSKMVHLIDVQNKFVNKWPDTDDWSLQTNVNLTFLLGVGERAKKHSLLSQLLEYLSERGFLSWKDSSGVIFLEAVFLTQYK